MAIKAGIVLLTIALGALALPAPESGDSTSFFTADTRIVGGSQAADGAHPHMAALTTGLILRSLLCGGSVIAARSVLTAAHCIDAAFSFGSLTSSLRITVGTNAWNSGGQTYSLSGNATHPNYVSSIIKNDIGILFTSSAIAYTNSIRAIPLSFNYVGAGVNARAAGWGRVSANGALSARLLEIVLGTIDGQQCVRDVAQASVSLNVAAPAVQPHIELCTVHPNGVGFGTCRGDSGSALVRVDNGQQIGIVSWGFPCARGAPDMFVRVSAYDSWVQQHIRH